MGEEISFDEEMAAYYGCRVHAYDRGPHEQVRYRSIISSWFLLPLFLLCLILLLLWQLLLLLLLLLLLVF